MPNSESTVNRSVPCNGKLISQLRRKLGWTQNDLARKAGFTERLIVKAEGSQKIAVSTLHIISETFCEAGATVSAADLSSDPAALAKEFIRAMYQHGPNVVDMNRHFLSPEIVVHFAGDPNVFPFAGTHVGIEAARQAFIAFYSVLQPPEDHSEINSFQFVSTGHGALVWGETWAHPIGKPMPGPIKLAIKMDFRDGLMIVFDDRFDTQEGAKHFADAIERDD
jgi:transcriptional regulator with XRE-family HTH domain